MPKTDKVRVHALFRGLLPESSFVMARKVVRKSSPTISAAISECTACQLCKSRSNTVPGEGSAHPELMFVGHVPGEAEEFQGRPFVGEAGQLLDKMIEAMGVKRSDVFLTNLVKCRPPADRLPQVEESTECLHWLKLQMQTLKPKIVIALGESTAQRLLAVEAPLGKLRGEFHSFEGVKLIATFHPADLLKTPSAKKDGWEDLKMAMKELGWKVKGKT